MHEVCDVVAKQVTIGGVVNGLVIGMGANADGGITQIELHHVDRVQRIIPSLLTQLGDVIHGNRVIMQAIVRYIVLIVDHVFNALILLVLGIHCEEDVLVSAFHLAEGRHQRGLVAIADVVLLTASDISTLISDE